MNPRPCGWTEAYFAFLALPAPGQPTTVPAVAHGKNFSLRYQAGAVSLAPFYDLRSTVAYPDLSPKLAMRIARKTTLGEVEPATWPALAALDADS